MRTNKRVLKTYRCSFLLLAFLLPLSGWATDTAPPKALTIFFTGYVHGNFGPCGCLNNPTGGLARRAGYAGDYQERTASHGLHVDAGNYFQPLGPTSKKINDFLIEGLRTIPIQVLNLAPGDIFVWKDLARDESIRDRIISTNLAPKDSSLDRPARYAVVTVPRTDLATDRDLPIGFLGISDPRKVKPNSGFKAQDPLEAIAEVKADLMKSVDFLIVLADIPRERGSLSKDSTLYKIAEAHPEVYAILSTEKRYMLHRPEQVNNAVILSSIERGRHLGQLRLTLDSAANIISYGPEFIEMNEGVPEDPTFLKDQRRLESQLP